MPVHLHNTVAYLLIGLCGLCLSCLAYAAPVNCLDLECSVSNGGWVISTNSDEQDLDEFSFDGTNHLYEEEYHLDFGASIPMNDVARADREIFDTLTLISATADEATNTIVTVFKGQNLTATVTRRLVGTSAIAATLNETIVLANGTGTSTAVLWLIEFNDWDINANSSNDTGSYNRTTKTFTQKSGTTTAEVRAFTTPDHFDITRGSESTVLQDNIVNGHLRGFAGPVGPDDLSHAFQYNLSIPAGTQVQLRFEKYLSLVQASEAPPDLIVISPKVSNSTPNTGQSFTISATVRNAGGTTSNATTLRYYRSADASITTGDVAFVATDPVASLAPGATSPESAPVLIGSAGTFWVGTCVGAVAGESPTNNNCSAGVRVTVGTPTTPGPSAGNPCDSDFVSVDASGDFLVTASNDQTGVTDTTNLQCTNDAIENLSFHAVKLKNGAFYIKEISLHCPASKSCTFAGTTRVNTVLNLVNNSIDCQGRIANNIVTGALSFRGNITVQFMTIRGDAPCMGDGFLPGLIVFTGAPAEVGNNCGNSVLFGTLNRVSVHAQSFEIDSGVLVFPQGRWLGGSLCRDGLSGSFTSTRASIDGSFVGLNLSMHAGARVGLDFLESTNSVWGIRTFNSNAITAINFCTVSGTATADFNFVGIKVDRLAGAPNTTTTIINKCTINVASEPGVGANGGWGVFVRDSSPPSNMPVVISGSVLNQMGPDTFGLQIVDASDCTITGNTFNGSGGDAISLWSVAAPVSGCTVTANTGLAGFTSVFDPIFLSVGTVDNVVGPHPGASIRDDGCNFNLNEPAGGCALIP